MSLSESHPDTEASPFDLTDSSMYGSWRENKLVFEKPLLSDVRVSIDDPYRLGDTEKHAILKRCTNYNLSIYELNDVTVTDKSLVRAMGEQLDLLRLDANLRSDEDSVSSLEVKAQAGNMYIPYTDKPLSWHTDGYYNTLDNQINTIVMHCASPAADGGITSLLDHEILYIKLRDENPDYIQALMHPQAMTIPDNLEAGKVIRAEQAGPVFSLKPDGRLHMRFSARKRNIIWRDTDETHAAVAMINEYMADENNILKVALQAGQGVICNNVLHNRSGFIDSETQKRLLYRARFYDFLPSIY